MRGWIGHDLRGRIAACCAALLALLGGLTSGAFAQDIAPIVNIAEARWREAGADRQVASNRVSVEVAARPASITTYRAQPGAGRTVAFIPSVCAGTALSTPRLLTAAPTPARAFRPGEEILFEIAAPLANADPGAIDRLSLVATAAGGARQVLTVFETGADSGLFFGSIATAAPAGGGDCWLRAGGGENVILEVQGTPSLRGEAMIEAPREAAGLTLSASRPLVQPGDVVVFGLTVTNPDRTAVLAGGRVTVTLPRGLRLRPETLRINDVAVPGAVSVSPDGLRLTITLDTLPPGGTLRIAYAAAVRADAAAGQLETLTELQAADGRSARANAVVRVVRDTIAGRMTIIGRVVAGDCRKADGAGGLAGVRVMMEDGSFAITDAEGRYHFEGVVPGTHVVQIARATLPQGAVLAECTASTRTAGDVGSRFVAGQGGSLARADFHVVLPEGAVPAPAPAPAAPAKPAEPAAEPAKTDWLTLGDGPDGWLAPEEDHNPRYPAVKVAFRHRPGTTIRLTANGQPVDETAFEGTAKSADGRYAVSLWRGIPLLREETRLVAETLDAGGTVTARAERVVHYSTEPARIALVPEQSLLVADGVTRPVITVRITDRKGRPVREGLAGDFALNAPFESAAQIDLQQIRQLSGVGAATARWVVEGDEGLARIELAPTMVSGLLRLTITLGSENIRRQHEIEAWIVPGETEWTLVGLGEASVGARSVADNMERGRNFDSDLGPNARVALYAKGRVLGKYLLTLAYDSAKQRADQPLLGAIDPTAYYTVFGDTSQRRFDAASREKLYVRIETSRFQALYGDFQTGFDETTLGRYQRTATGVQAQAQFGAVRAEAFGASIASRFRRDEFQGNGLAGPYPLGNRALLINSERVTIEVRDRFRPGAVVSTRSLTRFIDYTIDVLSGTISFSEPVLSRDNDLNPQIIVIEYETAEGGEGDGPVNAGVRADWTSSGGAVRLGATAITDRGEGARTTIAVADVRARLGQATEARAEVAVSTSAGDRAEAWQVELQHQTGQIDVIGYARSVGENYGTGQQSLVQAGRRQIGVDARYAITDQFTATLGALEDLDLTGTALRRRALRGELVWRDQNTEGRIGLNHFADRLADGSRAGSTVLETAGTQRLFDNRLELSGATGIALGEAGSVDLPLRHRLGLRYAITPDVRLTGAYEIAEGAAISARTLRAGAEVTPWQGSALTGALGRDLGEGASRDPFLALGLSQSFALTPSLTLIATLDGNRVLGAGPPSEAIINPAQPLAYGGPLSLDRTAFEDFTAATLSGNWRADRWSANARAEFRDGALADRMGLTFGVIRQIGEGRSLGGNALWTRASAPGGQTSQVIDAALTFAHRPDGSPFALLARGEYRSDLVRGAVAGALGPTGRTALDVDGDALARRLIGSVSANWSPVTRGGGMQLSEAGLFLAARYSLDRIGALDLAGMSALAGLDLRLGLGPRFDIGGSASLRANLDDGSFSYAIGPQASMVVTEGALLSVGYNIAGFRDPDFSIARALDPGLFAAIRFKFDGDGLSAFGAGSRPWAFSGAADR